MPTTLPPGTPTPPSQPLRRWRWLTTQSKARGKGREAGVCWVCPLAPLPLLLHPHPFHSLCPLPACVPLPGAAVSSKGERENRYSDTNDPRAVTLESSRCSPPGPACPWPHWPQPDADCRPAALPPPVRGHDLHIRLWPRFLHLCLVLPSESINYLKQGKEKPRRLPCPAPPPASAE